MTDEQYEKAKTEYEKNRRILLKVKIHGDKTADELNFIRWDKDLTNKQKEKIIAAVEALPEYNEDTDSGFDQQSKAEVTELCRNKIYGSQIHGTLAYLIGQDDAAISRFLINAGIDGIKYPTDYQNDKSEKGSFNYVVFDENAIEISEKIRLMATSKSEVYGFVTPDGDIYLDPAKLNANTPIHEFGHLWCDFVEKNNPELWAKIAELTKETPYFKNLQDNPAYANLKTDNARANEAFAQALGDEGERVFHDESLGATFKDRFRQLLRDFWA
jgi:hypothetical protein